MEYPEIANAFRKALSDKHMSQQQLSDLSGISKGSISKYCNGNDCPRGKRVLLLADILGVEPAYLLGLSDTSKTITEAPKVKKKPDRKSTTERLQDILFTDRLAGAGRYWAKEVTLDYGTSHPIRVDYMQYVPNGAVFASDIENGYFICYEVKSCKADVYSGNGLNFIAEKNYIVTTMECYKELMPDMQSGKLMEHIKSMNNGRLPFWDFLIAIPDYEVADDSCKSGFRHSRMIDEFDEPTPVSEECRWKLVAANVGNIRGGYRTRGQIEMLFCMLRAGRG